ncbi:RICIN domain-containing protein [Kitasatospora sp. CM 4170]|uniref:RICIN domain-containing protein n=1 Tax=Kitasatospora aburaviensis TaxID=67265 RepID=A0ABW1F625_9ACTN|nr:RICIN domain-containing protein [Kitasatospora sp. CM 4170]WNM48307.1 RICIN domain-containing protein [Kitasatospora sp. CM 4170]
MPDSATDLAADAELARAIRAGHEPDLTTLADTAHRHRESVVAYAGLFCAEDRAAEDRAAEELADEAFERTLAAVRTGAGPTASWRPYLLAEVRRAAADWADTGREARLSDGFAAWLGTLPRPDPADPSARAAVASAEADSYLLRAFLNLPEHRQAALWHCLGEPIGNPSTPPPEPDAPGRQILYDAYLQVYASRVPHRSCRHLVAALGEFVRHGATDDTAHLDRHLAQCDNCGHARAVLAAIDLWQRPVLLRGLLLWTGEPSSPSPPALPAVAADTRPTPTVAPRPTPRTRAWPPHAGGRLGGRRALAAFTAAGTCAVAALLIAGTSFTTTTPAGAHPPVTATAVPLPGPTESTPPTSPPSTRATTVPGSPSDSPSPAPSPTESTVPASTSPSHSKSNTSATAAPSPTPSTPPPTVVVAPPPTVPVGLPLLNRSSGLCVGIVDLSAGSPLQLQKCTGQASQRWERLAADQDVYQLRNVETGMCLDGTTAGGNTVAVVLRSCRSGTQRAQQLWRFEPDARTGAVRLWFVPPVPSSDYASHLLGPCNWPEADPPRVGSPLVQLPNYYHSASFLFTMG